MIRLAAALWLLAALPSPARAAGPMPGESAFVEHRIALQISDDTAEKQALVLSVANNVLKVFGPDKVAIEVVAFGPGLALLRQGNPNADRIRSLVTQGVRFDACGNTMDTIERTTGHPFPLAAEGRRVTAGVVQLMILAEHGYTIIRP